MKLALAFALVGCTSTLDQDHRNGVGAATSTIVERGFLTSLVDLHDLDGIVSGTREQFALGGAIPNPWNATPATISGSGGVTELALAEHFTITVAGWRDELFDTTIDGTIDVTEDATFVRDGDLVPDTIDARVTGDLRLTDAYAGEHAVELALCYRGATTSSQRYGLVGTVDGESAVDHDLGNDPTCAPL
jgi:hypothetical protein